MWFADWGLAFSLVLLVAVAAAVALALLGRWAGWSLPSVRRAVWVGGTVTALLLVGQAGVVDSVEDTSGGAAALDQPVLEWFVAHRDPFATGFAIVLATIGGTAAMTVLTVVAVGVLLYLRRAAQAAVVAVTAAGGGLLVLGFKNLYGRDRPALAEQVLPYQGHSLPSGHALGSTVVLGVVAAVLYPALLGWWARLALVASAAVLALLIGVSRLYLAAHWLTDVLTGWLLGGAWLTAGITALVLLPAHRPARVSTKTG